MNLKHVTITQIARDKMQRNWFRVQVTAVKFFRSSHQGTTGHWHTNPLATVDDVTSGGSLGAMRKGEVVSGTLYPRNLQRDSNEH